MLRHRGLEPLKLSELRTKRLLGLDMGIEMGNEDEDEDDQRQNQGWQQRGYVPRGVPTHGSSFQCNRILIVTSEVIFKGSMVRRPASEIEKGVIRKFIKVEHSFN